MDLQQLQTVTDNNDNLQTNPGLFVSGDGHFKRASVQSRERLSFQSRNAVNYVNSFNNDNINGHRTLKSNEFESNRLPRHVSDAHNRESQHDRALANYGH